MNDEPKTRQADSPQARRAQREAIGITAAYIRELSNRHRRRPLQPSRRDLPQPVRASLQEGGTR